MSSIQCRLIGACLVTGAMLLGGLSPESRAAVVGFTDQPDANSSNWQDSVPTGTRVDRIDFDDHPLGPLNGALYESSLGVSLSVSNADGPVPFEVETGVGPGDYLTTGPLVGEGSHNGSNYLSLSRRVETTTTNDPAWLDISFDQAVRGVGLFSIDLYRDSELSLEAFDHADPDHADAQSLGRFNRAGLGSNNYQQNQLYFMGLLDDEPRIRSVRLKFGAGGFDSIGVDDIRVATDAIIPTPSTIAILGVGAVGLLGGRRRRPARG